MFSKCNVNKASQNIRNVNGKEESSERYSHTVLVAADSVEQHVKSEEYEFIQIYIYIHEMYVCLG